MRADRPERGRQDHPASPAGRTAQASRGRGDRERRHPASGSGLPGRPRLSGPGDPAVPAAVRRGSHPGGSAPEPALGRRVGAKAADGADDSPGPRGGNAVRGPAFPGRAGAHAGQAAPAAAARRAGGRARPAGPAELPGHPGRRGRCGRPDRGDVLAPGRRPGAGLRPHRHAGRVAGPALRRHRGIAGRASAPGRPAQGHLGDRARPPGRAGDQDTAPDHPARPAERPGHRPRVPGQRCQPGGSRTRLHGAGRTAGPGAPELDRREPMSWLVWRLHRTQLNIAAALLAAFTVLLLVTGLQMASQYHSAVTACAASHGCASLGSTLFLGSHAVGFLVIMTLGVPALFGLFWGAPLVASEFEAGTGQFAWMQSVTRKRWLAVTTGWTLLAAAAWGGAVSGLVTWWSGPDNALQLDQFKPGRFDIMGIVPVGYALFALALGVCAGALLRRTIPALAVTLGGFIAVRAVITLWLRPHYMSAVTVTYKLLSGYTPSGSYWQFAQGILDPAGRRRPMAPCAPPRPAGRRGTASPRSLPTSPPAATGRSRASRPASSWRWPPPSSPC